MASSEPARVGKAQGIAPGLTRHSATAKTKPKSDCGHNPRARFGEWHNAVLASLRLPDDPLTEREAADEARLRHHHHRPDQQRENPVRRRPRRAVSRAPPQRRRSAGRKAMSSTPRSRGAKPMSRKAK